MNDAIGLLTELVGSIATATFQVLMSGELPDFDGHSEEWVEQSAEVAEGYTPKQLEQHALVVKTVHEVSDGLLTGYIQSLIEVGLMENPLPSPDDVIVPDSVEEIDW
jgi:hypothetical protein